MHRSNTLSAGAGILQQLPGTTVVDANYSTFAQTNPYAQAAGLIATGAGGLGRTSRIMSVVLSRKLFNTGNKPSSKNNGIVSGFDDRQCTANYNS